VKTTGTAAGASFRPTFTAGCAGDRNCSVGTLRDLVGLVAGTAGDGDIVVVSHPEFSIGQIVRYRGAEAEVVSDDGPTIRISYRAYRLRNLDRENRTRTEHVCQSDIERGQLVAEQLV
jgi:hypothetical protein